MKVVIYNLFILISFFFISCEPGSDTDEINPDGNNTTDVFPIVGSLGLPDGPHDLAVNGNYVFACRNDKIYIVDISDVQKPVLKATFDDLENNNIFEALTINNNILYAGCTSSAGLYAIDISNPLTPVIKGKFLNTIYSTNKIKIMSLFYANNTIWAGGSNGSNGMIVKFNVQDLAAITAGGYWVSNQTGTAIEGIWANATHVFASSAKGIVYSFNAGNISAGTVGSYTFSNEAGHEHWGKSVVGHNNRLYWADWGAGIITIDISDPANMKSSALITHSSFKTDFPDAEGTNAYDVALNHTTGILYVANGWSGLLQIDIANPGKVKKYQDYKENQYYCLELYNNYVIAGDISTGIENVKGIKILKVE